MEKKMQKTKTRTVYLKSMYELEQCKDYGNRSTYRENYKSYDIWSIKRSKHTSFKEKIVDRYFGTGRSIEIQFRDDKGGINCYNTWFQEDYDLKPQKSIVYEWMFDEASKEFFTDKEFFI